MRLRWSATVAGSLLLVSATASAVAPRTAARRIAAETLTATSGAAIHKPLRTHRGFRVAPGKTAAWKRFEARSAAKWEVAWDPATHVPSRIWGAGIAAPGANADPAVAERVARALLAEHLDLLAPGASLANFRLVANHSDGDQRSIGFQQELGGRLVLGGQVSFRFKKDRLFVIASEALPDVRVAEPRARLAPATLRTRATEGLRRELALPDAPVTERGAEVILPLVADDAVLGYRVARPMLVDGGAEGRYLAYVEPATGVTIAVHQQNLYANGTLLYKSVDRHPARPRVDRPARSAFVTVGDAPQTTTATGQVTLDAATTVTTSVLGEQVTIVNAANEGALVSTSLPLAPGGTAIWDASAEPSDDAQVQVFLATNIVKDYVRGRIDPMMPRLDTPIEAKVNIADSCNAFFNGDTINFFAASDRCENTGLLQDVVYHEYGHAVHTYEIIPGVGSFDGAMSEGAADFLASSITNDSGMGRGFLKSDEPLRELDPPDSEAMWPRDIAEIHTTGLIYGGTFWDLRKAMIAKYGASVGEATTNKIFLGTMQRSTSIPTSLIEALAADDDDGNLENGTPNECTIREAYGRHGLRTATGTLAAAGALSDPTAETTTVRVDLSGLSARCGADVISKVVLDWRPSYTNVPAQGSVQMSPMGMTTYYAGLPLPQNEVVYYRATVTFASGATMILADNLADPYYQLYRGTTVPLYCTSFDAQSPFAEGWVASENEAWTWGVTGVGGGTDPTAAFSGTKVLGQSLGGEYAPDTQSFVRMPPIDVGAYSDVRLQYRRWLAVEDSFYDQARITVNGQQAWINYSQDRGEDSSIHHIDREWRFHDVRVSGFAYGTMLDIAFELSTDAGLHLGGWHLDDVCVVANPNSICGDGVRTPTEECDEGAANSDAPNGSCRTYCRTGGCGDSIIDDAEACDDGPAGSETCSASCALVEMETDGGCCGTSTGGAAPFALSGLVGLLLVRRRRR